MWMVRVTTGRTRKSGKVEHLHVKIRSGLREPFNNPSGISWNFEQMENNLVLPNRGHSGLHVSLSVMIHFSSCIFRYVHNSNATVRGAYNVDTILNYNSTPHSQHLPTGLKSVLPQELFDWGNKNQLRGDFLAIFGRKFNDSELSNTFVTNFKQGRFQWFAEPV